MKRFLILLLLIFTGLILVSCSNDTSSTDSSEKDYNAMILGEWKTKEDNYEDYLYFNEDGTYNEEITQTIDNKEVSYVIEGDYSIDDDKLSWAAIKVDNQTEDNFKKLGNIELTEDQIKEYSYYFNTEPSEIKINSDELIINDSARSGKTITFTRVEDIAQTSTE